MVRHGVRRNILGDILDIFFIIPQTRTYTDKAKRVPFEYGTTEAAASVPSIQDNNKRYFFSNIRVEMFLF